MKTLLHAIVLLALLNGFKAAAQNPLTVDVGPDTALCAENFSPFDIGGNTVISGGVEPFTYTWSTPSRAFVEVDLTQYDYPTAPGFYWDESMTASYIIDDTSQLHTDIFFAIDFNRNLYPSIPLTLTVQDSVGTTVSDTMQVSMGGYYYSTLNGKFVPFNGALDFGDTVRYIVDDRALGYLPLVSSEWFPKLNEMITSPFDFEVDVVMTDGSFDYASIYQIVTDINGCEMRFQPYDLMQYPLSSEEILSGSTSASVKVYPNPSEERVCIEGLPAGASIAIFDMQGRELQSLQSSSSKEYVSFKEAGIYMIRVGDEDSQWKRVEVVR